MDLQTFLKKHKLSMIAFAMRYGVAYTTVWRVVNGEGTPTVRVAKHIELATLGAVPAGVTLGLTA